jgi:NADH:ubiquinone reductase (H+-translocating)
VLLADNREIASRTVVWSAGIRARQLAGTDEMPRSRSRRLATEERLQIAGHPGVFAVGDVASMHIDGPELPMLSPPAMQEGRYVAQAILADLRGTRLRQPFATATVHIYYLIGFRNRAVVLINWAWNYLRRDQPIRMITSIERDPLTDELTASGTSGS